MARFKGDVKGVPAQADLFGFDDVSAVAAGVLVRQQGAEDAPADGVEVSASHPWSDAERATERASAGAASFGGAPAAIAEEPQHDQVEHEAVDCASSAAAYMHLGQSIGHGAFGAGVVDEADSVSLQGCDAESDAETDADLSGSSAMLDEAIAADFFATDTRHTRTADVAAAMAERRYGTAPGADLVDAPEDAAIGRWLDNPRAAFSEWKLSQRVRGQVEFDPHSIEQYTSMWGRFCSWIAERPAQAAGVVAAVGASTSAGLRVDDVCTEDIEHFLGGLRGGRLGDRPVAASTSRRYLFLLHRTFEHLERLGVVDTNPCGSMHQLQRHQAFERPLRALLQPNEETVFIAWCSDQPARRWEQVRNRALRLLFLASGITVSEARTLRVQDVHLNQTGGAVGEDGAALVYATVGLAAHGNTPARTAPVAAFAVPALADWLRVRWMTRAPGELVFNTRRVFAEIDPSHASPAPQALSAEEIYEIVAIALRECGYDRHRTGPATLRNSFMARQIRDGKPLERIQDWVGLRTVEPLRILARQVPVRHDGLVPG